MTPNNNPFAPATKEKAKLRMALSGLSGAGKTYSALALAQAIAQADDTRVALIDTENGSASKYAHLFTFETLSLREPYQPDRFIELIHAAEQYDYGVLVIDSLSAAWEGEGGLITMHEAATRRMGDSFRGWAEITPLFKRLMRAILNSKVHVIVTLQVTAEYVVSDKQGGGGKARQAVGTKPVMKSGFEYYFDIIGNLDNAELLVTKTRYPAITNRVIAKPGSPLGIEILEWLNAGTEPREPEPEEEEPIQRVAPTPLPQEPRHNSGTTPAQGQNGANRPMQQRDALAAMNPDIKRFWAQAKEHGFESKRAVHEALGLEVRDGALADWVANGHSYDQALTALKLGIPVIKEDASQPSMSGVLATAHP